VELFRFARQLPSKYGKNKVRDWRIIKVRDWLQSFFAVLARQLPSKLKKFHPSKIFWGWGKNIF